ncbi:MAG TPA: hypothetical protein VF988_15400 [Verrucomicrobiae bacterium]
MSQIPSQPYTAADYIVVVSNDDDIHNGFHHFAEKVNRKLKAGYQLVGQPFNINQLLCQAMLRPEGAPTNSPSTTFFKEPDELRML